MDSVKKTSSPKLFALLKPYTAFIVGLVVLALASNGFTLWLPKIMSHGIDGFLTTGSLSQTIIWQFSLAAVCVFILTYVQSIVQTYASEKVARDLRRDLSAKISNHTYMAVEKITSAKLLTNVTSDIDAIKNFVAQAIVGIASSLFIIIGVSVLLLMINWKLALAVLTIVPIIGATFFLVLSKVRVLFVKTREVVDALNKVINESILGAALVRVLNAPQSEYKKFLVANTSARDIGLQILQLFASMIPIVTFASNLAVLIILMFGGRFVIGGTMTLGDFAAFNNYLAILIFPIFILGFMSNIIAQAQASYGRIVEVLYAPDEKLGGDLAEPLSGAITVRDIQLSYGEKPALKDVSFSVAPGTRTAIIGPTAAGKTQLLYLLIGLIKPASGSIEYDGKNIDQYNQEALHTQIGIVFQDSIMFNMSIRENIAFHAGVSQADITKAIETAELQDFIDTLPEALDTVVSERGTSLSGGQKQRIMLARALTLNPKILLLDDFTARVDGETEKRIVDNIANKYPSLTLVSVTQKISSVEHYDQIIVLMEGELIASGIHKDLMSTSPEYVQIYNSQQSTLHL